jgi:uncharacterized membrane protein
MVVFVVPLVVFGALLLLDRLGLRPASLWTTRAKLRVALAAMFLFAASGRLAAPEGLLQMIPEGLPFRREALYLSGLFEALGGLGLLVPRLRSLAGWGLATLMVVVFPANVNVAINGLQIEGFQGAAIYQWLRLPVQIVLIWLTLWASRPERSDGNRRAAQTSAPEQREAGVPV